MERIKKAECPHLDRLKEISKFAKTVCEDCGFGADLRQCQTCGFISCCESHHAHDKEHFEKTGHPFIRPYRTNYDWLWCYQCKAYLD
ncbi:MAG: UBP-type zinc finger domain-containing protein [Candidatus Doudnabacteria bacterium]|nr:UBP-type zinc finger domain-containing protein [Candidatus Doudnabacteria bacterium]